MFLIGAIKPIAEKKLNLVLFLCDCLGEASRYEIKLVSFLYAVGLVAATKTLFKRKEKIFYPIIISKARN